MVFLLVTPAPYVFMLGLLTLWYSVSFMGINDYYSGFSIVYLFKGGLNADVA